MPATPRPELMSPAGDWDALRAAVANGADAVYFGLDAFNARHRATNFTRESLPEVMAYLHRHNVKGYLTFNVLIFSGELEEAVGLLKDIAAARVDAVIVQDLGLALLIKHLAPDLHVHGSTQMTLTEPRGMRFVRDQLGVDRVVLARELSKTDIEKIATALGREGSGFRSQGSESNNSELGTRNSELSSLNPEPRTLNPQIEVFIHGALCVAYSGQCLTSEALGGRSANRGQCAQACRLPYELIVDGQVKELGDKSYLLSPQDLAAYDLVDDLVKLGVSCFKIEGRLKSAQYVAATTQTYRAALDAAIGNRQWAIGNDAKQNLAQVFSRGFTHGFLSGVDHSELVPARFPKSRGIRVGTVVRTTRRGGVVVQLDPVSTNGRMKIDPGATPIKPGDGIVFDQGDPQSDEQGGRIYEIFPTGGTGVPPVKRGTGYQPVKPQNLLELTFATNSIDLQALTPGAIVWKTDDPEVRRRLDQSFARDDVARRLPVTAHVEAAAGQPLRLTLTDPDGRCASVVSQSPLDLARKHPLTLDTLRDQLGRLGDTPFELAALTADPLDPVMAPKSVLNDLRRQAADRLQSLRNNAHEILILDPDALAHLRSELPTSHSEPGTRNSEPSLAVLCRTLDQLLAVTRWNRTAPIAQIYCDFEDVRKYASAVPIAREHGLPIALATTRILKPGEEGLLKQVAAANPDAILVRNLAGLSFFREQYPDLPLLGDYSLNVANELTAGLYLRHGLRRLVPSYDLNWNQLRAMLTRIDASYFEAVVHQHMPMFHMEHCVFCHTLSTGKDHRDCGRPCDTHAVSLKGRDGQPHPLIADVGCRNTVYNAAAQSAAELIPQLKDLGVRLFRIELLRQTPDETHTLLTRYADTLTGRTDPAQTVRSLRVLSQLGVTRGTFDYE